MNSENTFNSITCSLEGINIIEASAGTGKTYNIENLYARLVLEKGFSVESILVVTYTEAATKELISRISSMLYELNMYYEGNKNLERVRDLANSISSPESEVKQRLSKAMLNLDNASIFTIHGFCSQILNDYAFESRILFNVNMETNIRLLIDDIVEDFWRKTFYNCEHCCNSLAAFNNISPESLADFINQYISKPNVEITPKIPSNAIFSKLSDAYNTLLGKEKVVLANGYPGVEWDILNTDAMNIATLAFLTDSQTFVVTTTMGEEKPVLALKGLSERDAKKISAEVQRPNYIRQIKVSKLRPAYALLYTPIPAPAHTLVWRDVLKSLKPWLIYSFAHFAVLPLEGKEIGRDEVFPPFDKYEVVQDIHIDMNRLD